MPEYTVYDNGKERSATLADSATIGELLAAAKAKGDLAFAGGVPVPKDTVLSALPAGAAIAVGRSGITLEEVSAHKKDKDAWIVLNAARVYNATELGLAAWIVYNITDYLDDHPGGKGIILNQSGACAGAPAASGGAAARARRGPFYLPAARALSLSPPPRQARTAPRST